MVMWNGIDDHNSQSNSNTHNSDGNDAEHTILFAFLFQKGIILVNTGMVWLNENEKM